MRVSSRKTGKALWTQISRLAIGISAKGNFIVPEIRERETHFWIRKIFIEITIHWAKHSFLHILQINMYSSVLNERTFVRKYECSSWMLLTNFCKLSIIYIFQRSYISLPSYKKKSLYTCMQNFYLPVFQASFFSLRRRKLSDEKMTCFLPRLKPFASGAGSSLDTNFSPELKSSSTNGV